MKKATTRRLFLRTAGITAAGITTMPSAFAMNSFSNAENLTVPSLEEATEIMNQTTKVHEHVLIHGLVVDKVSKEPIKNAQLEVWHQSSEPGKFAFHSRLITDENGRYNFSTKRPGKLKGKSPRINFKLSKPDSSYTTELIVTDFGAHITDNHWVLNQQMGEQLFPRQVDRESHTEFTFNLSI